MTQTKKKGRLEVILNIVVWSLGIFLTYWIILKLTNHSPTLDQINTGILLLVITLIFKQQHSLGTLEEFKRNTTKDFERVHQRMEAFENRMNSIEHKFDTKFDYLNRKIDVLTKAVLQTRKEEG